jgi:TPR repeat protein
LERGDALGDGVASHLLGTLLMDRGDLAAATELLQRALDRGIDDAALNLGNIYDRTGREVEALAMLTRAARAGNAEAARRLVGCQLCIAG